jgi:hypothetical protein
VSVDHHLYFVDPLAVLDFGSKAFDGSALRLYLNGLLYGGRKGGAVDLLLRGDDAQGAA